tara:strand:+ start:947 stop:1117 length:171 start_codon:yes stop_codon:yes gene_type:complete
MMVWDRDLVVVLHLSGYRKVRFTLFEITDEIDRLRCCCLGRRWNHGRDLSDTRPST